MPVLNIEGRRVRVGDEFLSMSPDEQQKAVEEIAGKIGVSAGSGAAKVDPATNQPPGVPEYVPPGVKGYNPQTGEVSRQYSMPGSAAMGAADAATLGWGDELASYLGSAVSGVPRQQVLSEMRGDAKSAQSQNPGSYMAGQIGGGLAQGVATGGAGLGTAAARTGAGLGKVALGSAVDGALYGGTYGAGSADDGDRLGGAKTGAITGAVVGGAMPLVVAGASSLARKAVTPFASSPERQAAVDYLAQEGVPLTAGQKTGSDWLRYRESELGGRHAERMMEKQGEAFTDAAMRKAGGAGLASPDNLAALKGGLGQQFEDIATRNTVVADPQLGKDIGTTLNRYEKLLEAQQKPIVSGLADDIISRFRQNNGTMPGTDYQAIRSDLTSAANSTSNKTLASAFRGLRDALDKAMDRSINPQDAGKWAALRRQYGNYKVLSRASTGGGEDAALGVLSPARLRMAASSGNQEGFATGASDFTKLAKAGQAVMTPLPNSGTAQRVAAHGLFSALLGGAGGTVAGLPGMAVGLAGPALAGRGIMSSPVQRYLANQAVTSGGNPIRNAVTSGLLRNMTIPLLEGN
jgi:hypothetical protein